MAEDFTNMGSSQTVSNSGHFVDYEFLPAVIVETDDPLHYGRIKVSALGAYNANNSSLEHLPWCYPFTMTGNNSYASYEKGSKVWIIRNKKRQDENWFIPMYEHHGMTQQFINNTKASNKPEVISMRNNGGNQSSITYDHGGGYNISAGGTGGGAGVNVGTNSSATMSGGGSAVNTSGSGVSLGKSGGDAHPAVLGDILKCILEGICYGIGQFAELLKEDPNAILAATFLKLFMDMLQNGDLFEWFLSDTVKINENKEAPASVKETKAKQEAEKAELAAKKEEEKKQYSAQIAAQQKYYSGAELTEEEFNALPPWTKRRYAGGVSSLNNFGQISQNLGLTQNNTSTSSTTTSTDKSVSNTVANNYNTNNYRTNYTAVSDQTSIYNNRNVNTNLTVPQAVPTINIPQNNTEVKGYDRYNSVLRQG